MSLEENVSFLCDMGFSEANSRTALEISKNNVQEALEWLLVHGTADLEKTSANEAKQDEEGDEEEDEESNEEGDENRDEEANEDTSTTTTATLKLTSSSSSAPSNTEEGQVNVASANSLKCEDCGILLKDEDFATLHAHKTGHINFSESTDCIKPKTKEEIEEQKKRLQEKLAKIRHEKAEKEKMDTIEQEKARRRQGREINDIKQKHHENELKRIAEEKRAEKKADAAYKQNLLNQIAMDREAKKKAREQEQEPLKGASNPNANESTRTTNTSENQKKDYDECKIQVKQTDGKSMMHVFKASEQLAAVRLWIEMNRTDCSSSSGMEANKFNLMQTFPKKVFTHEDMHRTLADLRLTPASSLVITKV